MGVGGGWSALTMLSTLTLTTASTAVAVSVLRVPWPLLAVAYFDCPLAEVEEMKGEVET